MEDDSRYQAMNEDGSHFISEDEPTGASPAATEEARGGVFEAVERGEAFDTDIHDAVLQEDPIVELDSFNLWYGDKQAIFGNRRTRVPTPIRASDWASNAPINNAGHDRRSGIDWARDGYQTYRVPGIEPDRDSPRR